MNANLLLNALLYGIYILKTLNMKWIIKRIRFDAETDDIMSKLKLRKQEFIRIAIAEKLERDFKIKSKIPF